MLSKNTVKIVEFLLRRPKDTYNVNQLSKEVGISVGSAHKILKNLENKTLINTEPKGNAIYYSLNMKNRETQKISGIVLIESKNKALSANPVAKVYAQDIEKISSAEAIVLFGSLLEEKEKANDADVFFLIKNKKHVKKITADCLETSKTKTKPIVPLIMTCNDMKNKIQEQNPVILEILKSGVVVFGEDAIVEVLSNV